MTVRQAILFPMALAAILRIGLLLLFAGDPAKVAQPDSVQYRQLGFELARSGRFVRQIESGATVPEIFRTPGYPAIIAAVRIFAGEARLPLIFVQCLLGIGAVGLTAWIGSRLGGPPAGLIAGLLLAVNPASIHLDNLILSESPYTFLLMLSTACLFLEARSQKREATNVLASGVLSGLATLVRPFGLLMGVAVVPAILLGTKRPLRLRIAFAALWLAAHLLPVGLWTIRNGVQSGVWTFTTVTSYNLLVFQAATIRAADRGETCDVAGAALLQEVQTRHPDAHWCGAELPDAAAAEAMKWIRSAPHRLLLEAPGTFRRLYLGEAPPYYEDAFFGERSKARGGPRRLLFLGWVLAQWGTQGMILLAAVLGIVTLARSREWFSSALLALCIAYPFILMFGTCSAYYRFRAPFDSFLALAAAVGILWAVRIARARIGIRIT